MRAPPRSVHWLILATTWMVACEPTDEVVFRGPDAGTGGETQMEGTGGASGGTGTGGVAAGGVATGGVPLATGGVPGTGGAVGTGGAGAGPSRCRTNGDCEFNETCNKARCEDEFGACELPPLVCDSRDSAAVCGCDGITYWNDCLRLQHRVPSGTAGECRSRGIRCFAPQDCGVVDATCALFLPSVTSCSQLPPAPPPGTCWVPPPTCEPTRDRQRWQRCTPFAPAEQCLDFCHALQGPGPGLYVLMPPNSCGP